MKRNCEFCYRNISGCKRVKFKDKEMIVLICAGCRKVLPKRSWKYV